MLYLMVIISSIMIKILYLEQSSIIATMIYKKDCNKSLSFS